MGNGQIDWKTLLFIVGAAAGAGFGGGSISRTDPFTGSEGELLKREILVAMREMEQRIRSDMPPTNTRIRIRAIENYLEHHDHDGLEYEVPTYDWQ